jgi:hypothetical protein
MKHTRVTDTWSQIIRLGKCSFTAFQVFEPKTLYICGEVHELAKPSMCMTMKSTNKRCVVEVFCLRSKWTLGKRSFELATNIESATQIFAEDLE